MVSSSIDLHSELNFSAKVRSLLGARVMPLSSDEASSFWLLASFPWSCLKLTEETVGFLLQSVLGGSASLFSVVQVDNWVFKFRVSSKEGGLLVYQLGFFQCVDFNVTFNLWNERVLSFAKRVIAEAQGIHFPWNHVESRRLRKFAPAQASHPVCNPLMGANTIPMRRSGMLHQQSSHGQDF